MYEAIAQHLLKKTEFSRLNVNNLSNFSNPACNHLLFILCTNFYHFLNTLKHIYLSILRRNAPRLKEENEMRESGGSFRLRDHFPSPPFSYF